MTHRNRYLQLWMSLFVIFGCASEVQMPNPTSDGGSSTSSAALERFLVDNGYERWMVGLELPPKGVVPPQMPAPSVSTSLSCACGDWDGDRNIDISDISGLIDYLFMNKPLIANPACMNVDGKDDLDSSDLSVLMDFLYSNGPSLACAPVISTSTPTATPSPSATPTMTPTPSPMPTSIPGTPTPTPTPTASPTPTPTPTPGGPSTCENRYPITSSCLCNGANVSSGYCCYYSVYPTKNIVHQTNQCGYTEVSPHWEHFLAYKEDYRYLSAAQRSVEYPWMAKHFDGIVGNVDERELYNPALQTHTYRIDQTYFAIGSTSDSGTAIPDHHGLYAEMTAWTQANGKNIEDVFYHFSEPTTISYTNRYTSVTQTLAVPGCSGTPTKACRAMVHVWDTLRWIINPGHPTTRAFFASNWAKITSTKDAYGNTFDGFFLDEHPYLPLGGTSITGGGHLSENGFRWTDSAFGDQYQQNMVDFLSSQTSQLKPGQKVIPNAAEWSVNPEAVEQALASSGQFMEFMLDPNRQESSVKQMWDTTLTLTSQKKMSILVTRQKFDTGSTAKYIPAYTPGNYIDVEGRGQIMELGMYYIAKDIENRYVYYNFLGAWGVPYSQNWPLAAEVDIGKPTTGTYSVYATGTDANSQSYRIYSREFSKGLVLVRPKAGYSYNTFNDTTLSTVITFSSPMKLVQANGTTTTVSTIRLRNSEAAILLK